jgi:UDP-N-acetylglucosamine acyltransferase
VHVAHDCVLRNNIVIANCAQLAGHVHVDDYARISGLAAIHHFVRIGTCAFVAGCAKLSIDVPPFTLAEGHPARIRSLNKEGLKRRGLSEDAMKAIRRAFRLCFEEDVARAEAYKELAENGYDKVPEVKLFVEFIQATERGKHGRALEAVREVVPVNERDGRMAGKGQDAEDA